MKGAVPLNDSLNASRLRWGLPLPIIVTLLVISGLVGWWYSTFVALVLVIGVPFLSSRLIAIDPNIYRLAAMSLKQKAHYYPGKRRS